jgi:citrate lyase synthetase
MNKKYFIVLIIFGLLVIATACSVQKISDIKTDDNIGKTVTVSGTVEKVLKVGSISGYILKDDTGSISVSTQKLPSDGDKLTVKGVLIKDTLIGYYIKVN